MASSPKVATLVPPVLSWRKSRCTPCSRQPAQTSARAAIMQSRVFIGIWTASTKFKGYDLGCVAPWVVYIVRCRDGSLYTGATCDLPARLLAHNAGKGA